MSKPKLVLSPCGTSLLTNKATDKDILTKYANAQDIPRDDLAKLESLIKSVEKDLESASLEEAAKMSAELNGIIKLYGGQLNKPKDIHVLISTDTYLGKATADLVAKWLKDKGFNDIRQPLIKGLQTADLFDFQHALSEIVQWCSETIPSYQKAQYHIVFNLTGGFKSVQGFLQTLAMFYADETIYIFEGSKDLLRIPRLPVEMKPENSIVENFEVFRRLANGLTVSNKNLSKIPGTLLTIFEKEVDLSPWGKLVWEQTKEQIYSQKLHPSPSKKFKYGPRFEPSVEGLSKDRLCLINERIDNLAVFLEKETNPKSLDFKKLNGNPCPPSTHEIDAWQDQDAKRIFGHYEDSLFILDQLDKHL